jgi:23S rRNA (adenine2503-C2)-methyltransferase
MTQTESRFPAEYLGLTLEEFAARTQMHVIPARPVYRKMMRQAFGVWLPAITRREDDGGTVKFCLPAGEFSGKALESESVIIPMTSYRASSWHTLCVSTQIGCRMGCTFCETGKMGLLRNLSAAEIVRQRIVAGKIRNEILSSQEVTAEIPEPDLQARPRRGRGPGAYFADGIQNIVFMGMGEPLDNFDEVTQAIRVLSDPAGLDFPKSQITVSTVGRIDGLKKLAALKWPTLRLAISLNAATDKLRDELMPINKGMPLAELRQALVDYPFGKKARFMVEYVLIAGVNDSPADADAVAAWCKGLPCIVNVIPYNPQRFASFTTPTEEVIGQFIFRLKSHKIFTKRRITHGRDLMGACGQLGNPEVKRSKLKVLN